MGGKLFDCKRVSSSEYEEISYDILSKFSSNRILAEIAPSLKKKESHGDIDIIVSGDALNNERIKEIFGAVDIHRNSNVISILFFGVQVDLNFHAPENFRTAVNYNSHGDLSNILGRIFHSIGYSLGHEGLSYYVRFSDEDVLGKILVSKDQDKILSFIGLDFETWAAGFDTQEDVYEWVSQSKYFNWEKFKFEELNHINRIRNKKRPMYADFVTWCSEKTFANYYVCKNKTEHLFRGMLHFGCDWMDSSKVLIDNRRLSLAVKNIFSGADLLPLGDKGKELGAKLNLFKLQFANWDKTVLESNKKEMIEKFLLFEKSEL